MRISIRWKWKSLLRAYTWAKFGCSHYDWDYEGVFNLIEFKIDRLIKEFKKCKIHYHSKDLQNLRKLKKSLKYVHPEYWENIAEKKLQKKWGRCRKLRFICQMIIFTRTRVKSKRDQTRYYNDLRKVYNEATVNHTASLAEFHRIFQNIPFYISC